MLAGDQSNIASSWSAKSSNMLPMSSRMDTVVFLLGREMSQQSFISVFKNLELQELHPFSLRLVLCLNCHESRKSNLLFDTSDTVDSFISKKPVTTETTGFTEARVKPERLVFFLSFVWSYTFNSSSKATAVRVLSQCITLLM